MNKVLFGIGICLLLLPLVMKGISNGESSEVIATYQKELEQKESKEIEKCLQQAIQYNEALYQEGIFWAEEYDKQLNVLGNGLMCSLEIPKIELKLPVYHGTEEEVLSQGIGHLKESSLPVGGANTHSVLSGHRGLPSAELFTRLDELQKGDCFYITVCNQKLCYRVTEIQVVEPEDVTCIAIREGEDLVSLVTCTPYGINTHRLVITGERDYSGKIDDASRGKLSNRELACIAFACLFVLIASSQIYRKRRKRMRKLLPLLAMGLMLFCPMRVFAAQGNIEVQLPETQDGMISYTKVGNMVNGEFVLEEEFLESKVDLNELETAKELEEAAKSLTKYKKSGVLLRANEEGIGLVQNLEEGVYLLNSYGSTKQEIMPTLVYLPTWSEAEGKMLLNVTVIPKCVEKKEAPVTGQSYGEELYGIVFVGALCITLGVTRKKIQKKSAVF